MTDVVLCPNCHGDKQVSQPHILTTYPCPTCGGRGWVDPDEEFDVLKGIALSAMETAENLMDECVIRGERIKDLETKVDGKDDVIVRLMEQRTAIRKDCNAHRDALRAMVDERDEQIVGLKSKNRCAARDIMLLDVILKHVNPAIRLGRWRTTVGSGDFMRDVCNDVVAFRSKHDECKECGIPLGYEYGDARMNGMCVYCFANHKEIV